MCIYMADLKPCIQHRSILNCQSRAVPATECRPCSLSLSFSFCSCFSPFPLPPPSPPLLLLLQNLNQHSGSLVSLFNDITTHMLRQGARRPGTGGD